MIVDTIIGVVPVVLAVAFLILIVRSMTDGRTGMVDRMKQAVGGAVMLLVALMVVFAFLGGGGGDDPVPDPEPQPGPDYPYLFTVEDGEATLIGWDPLYEVPESFDLEVPAEDHEGNPVTAIGPVDSSDRSPWAGVVSLSAPTVTAIGDNAFSGCTSLTSVDLPEIVTIGDGSFDGCLSIETIAFGSGLESVGTGAFSLDFYDHFAIAEVPATAPGLAGKTYNRLGDEMRDAFVDPTMFTFNSYNSADYTCTVTGWGGQAPSSEYTLDLPEYSYEFNGHVYSVTELSSTAGGSDAPSPWALAVSAESSNITFISGYTFKQCGSLVSVDFPAVTSVGNDAFKDCTALEEVSFPSLSTLGERMFYRCTSLAYVDLPSATTINRNAFASSGIVTLDLPAVTSIKDYAFMGVTTLTKISFGPLSSLTSSALDGLTFYDTDGTTALSKTNAANFANSTFEGVYNALVKVPSGQQTLTEGMQQRVLELSAENTLKASMLKEIDPELADLDGSEVARMTVEDIRALTSEDVEAMKEAVRTAKAAGGE